MTWQTHLPFTADSIRALAIAPSLTAALLPLGAFCVQLNFLGETQICGDFVDFRLPETVFTREVMLQLDSTNVVHAHSFCDVHSHWREILDCGQIPLGEILFSGSLNGLTRGPIQFRQPDNALLARRSWFEYRGEKLYLVEYFLPEILQFLSGTLWRDV